MPLHVNIPRQALFSQKPDYFLSVSGTSNEKLALWKAILLACFNKTNQPVPKWPNRRCSNFIGDEVT